MSSRKYPASSWLYRLGVSQAQKAKVIGTWAPAATRFIAFDPNLPFSFPFLTVRALFAVALKSVLWYSDCNRLLWSCCIEVPYMEVWLYLQNLVLTIMSTQPNVRNGQPMVTVIVFLGWRITVPSRVTCVVRITVSETAFSRRNFKNPYRVVRKSVHTIFTCILITELAKSS